MISRNYYAKTKT